MLKMKCNNVKRVVATAIFSHLFAAGTPVLGLICRQDLVAVSGRLETSAGAHREEG